MIERFNASIGFDITLAQDLDARDVGQHRGDHGRGGRSGWAGSEQVRAEAAAGQFNPGLEDEDVLRRGAS